MNDGMRSTRTLTGQPRGMSAFGSKNIRIKLNVIFKPIKNRPNLIVNMK